jgi:thiamine monophosphate kinase
VRIDTGTIPAAPVLKSCTARESLVRSLCDGEDYELLFTVPAAEAGTLQREWNMETRLTRIGECTAGSGVLFEPETLVFRPGELSPYAHEF